MKHQITDTDIFKLVQLEQINTCDYQVLFMLYQPIIGTNAINLYLTLTQEKSLTNRINLDFNHGRIKTLLMISTAELEQAFKQLEVVQLIKSYYHPLKLTYIYEIIAPLSATNFFSSTQLNPILLKNLGSLNYERQKFYFSKSNTEITNDYIEISSQEKNIPTTNLKTVLNGIYKNNQEKNSISNFPFPTNTPLQQQAINLEMAKSPVATKNTSENINTIIENMKEKEPNKYLMGLTGKNTTEKLKVTISTLINTYHLDKAVINCLIEYVWFKNNKRLEPNYILKIAQTFTENNINTVNEALNHLKLAYSRSAKNPMINYQQESIWTTNETTAKKISSPVTTAVLPTVSNLSQEEINNILKEFDSH